MAKAAFTHLHNNNGAAASACQGAAPEEQSKEEEAAEDCEQADVATTPPAAAPSSTWLRPLDAMRQWRTANPFTHLDESSIGGSAAPSRCMSPQEQSKEEEAAEDCEQGGECQDKRSLHDIIESIGLGWAQARMCLIGGSIWMADGAELLLVGTVTRAVSEEWGLEAVDRGSVVSIVFVGILCGNALAGPLGDRLGRRKPIIMSYIGVFAFSVLSALSTSFAVLASVRLLVGASFGIGQPTFGALCSESTPTRWRIVSSGIAQSLFVGGELYSVALVWFEDPTMQDLKWRRLLMLGAIPSMILGILAFFFLMPSPSYLAVRGDYEGAKKVLKTMGRLNGKPDISVEFRPPEQPKPRTMMEAYIRPLRLIYAPRMLFSTLAVCFSCFVLNTIYYGCLYAMPQVVSTVDMGTLPALTLLLGALWEYPGLALGVACGMLWRRKPAMAISFGLTGLALVAFVIGLSGTDVDAGESDWYHDKMLHAGYMGAKMFPCIGYIVVYQYSTEIYPTEARTTGCATSMAAGRIGGIMAPMLFEKLLAVTGGFSTFFQVGAILCAVNCVLVLLLPVETFGKKLEDTAPFIATEAAEEEPEVETSAKELENGHLAGPPRPVPVTIGATDDTSP